MKATLYTYKNWFFEALFPPKCLICKKEGAYLCLQHQPIKKASENAVIFQFLDGIYARAHYFSVPAEKLVEFFKFKGVKDLAEIMVESILEDLPSDFLHERVLVPVPLHWTRRFWRGFNQAESLAKVLKNYHPHLEISTNLLRKKRTTQQARLGKRGRMTNLESAFIWKGQSTPKKVILIDDVVASGATLDSAAKTLKLVGVEEVLAIVFARGGK